MSEIFNWIKSLIGNDTFQGILALLSSSAFIALLGVLKNLFGNKRITNIIGQAKSIAANSETAIKTLQEKLDKAYTIIEELEKQVATTQDITLTYVLNSKASASTKNEVIRIAGGVEAKQEVVNKAIENENEEGKGTLTYSCCNESVDRRKECAPHIGKGHLQANYRLGILFVVIKYGFMNQYGEDWTETHAQKEEAYVAHYQGILEDQEDSRDRDEDK